MHPQHWGPAHKHFLMKWLIYVQILQERWNRQESMMIIYNINSLPQLISPIALIFISHSFWGNDLLMTKRKIIPGWQSPEGKQGLLWLYNNVRKLILPHVELGWKDQAHSTFVNSGSLWLDSAGLVLKNHEASDCVLINTEGWSLGRNPNRLHREQWQSQAGISQSVFTSACAVFV